MSDEREMLRSLTVELLLCIRSMYLRTTGANVLKHWDQISDRLRSAARRTTNPEEWFTAMSRSLNLSSPTSDSSACLAELADFVRSRGAAGRWIALLEQEHGYLMAMTRLAAEQAKKARMEATTEEEDTHV